MMRNRRVNRQTFAAFFMVKSRGCVFPAGAQPSAARPCRRPQTLRPGAPSLSRGAGEGYSDWRSWHRRSRDENAGRRPAPGRHRHLTSPGLPEPCLPEPGRCSCGERRRGGNAELPADGSRERVLTRSGPTDDRYGWLGAVKAFLAMVVRQLPLAPVYMPENHIVGVPPGPSPPAATAVYRPQ